METNQTDNKTEYTEEIVGSIAQTEEIVGSIAQTGEDVPQSQKRECRARTKLRRFQSGKFWDIAYNKGSLYFILAFVISAVIMSIAMAEEGIRPFKGNNQMLVVDLWHQYYPFFRVEREKLLTGGSFFYSWQNGLGSNFISLISYYAMSPLNWLSVFWDGDHVREALTVILIMKIGFAGAFFQRFLRYTYRRNDFSTCVFSVMYSLSSFTLGYYWNVMWFDTIALFPLVMLGIVKICREGKWKTYTFSLALSLIANYYIGYFTCIFSVFMFFAAGAIEFRGVKDWLYKFWVMIRSSILGLALSAFITVPAYLGLQTTYSADNRSIWEKLRAILSEDTKYYESWKSLLANTISYNAPTKVEGLPNFACGMLALVLFGVFLFSFRIKLSEKISTLIMLYVIVISCNMRQLNYIWHGFHFTNQIPYRFAFIFSFVLAAAAYRAYDVILTHGIKLSQLSAMFLCPAFVFWLNYEIKRRETAYDLRKQTITFAILELIVLAVIVISAAVLLTVMKKKGTPVSKKNVRFGAAVLFTVAIAVLTVSPFIMLIIKEKSFRKNEAFTDSLIITGALLLIFVAAKVFPFRRREVRNAVMSIALAAAVFSEFYANTCKGVQTVGHSSYTEYPTRGAEVTSLVNTAKQADDELFYRTEMNDTWTLNDSALYGYYGISQFSSAANVDVTRLCKRLGLYGSEAGNRYYYHINTPITNAIFSLKYMIRRGGEIRTDSYTLDFAGKAGGSYMYQNRYFLPIGFMVSSDVLNMENKEAVNPFEYQNEIMRVSSGSSENCLVAQPVKYVEYTNMDVTKSGYGNYSFRVPEPSKVANTKYTFAHKEGMHLYGYGSTTGGACNYITVLCGNVSIESGDLISKYPIVFPMGNGAEGDETTIEIKAADGRQSGNFKLVVYALDEKIFNEQFERLADEKLELTSFSDKKIKGTVNALEDGVLYLSIPYEKGWTAYIDGKKTDTFRVFGAMMGVKVAAGEHDVRLEYVPEGLVPGVIVSGCAAAATGALIWFEFRRKKKKNRRSSEPADITAGDDPESTPAEEETVVVGEIYNQAVEEVGPQEAPAAAPEVNDEKPEGNDGVQGD